MNMKTNSSVSSLPPADAGKDCNGMNHGPGFPTNSCYIPGSNTNTWSMLSTTPFVLLICLFGFVGNGTVIWLLGFRIKRNPITTYILHLSIADFGVVTALVVLYIYWLIAILKLTEYCDPLRSILYTLFQFAYSASQFLLTVISIDRCVAVFCPFWYRCHRSPQLSTRLCAIIWILTFLLPATHISLFLTTGYCRLRFYQFMLNTLVFTPVMSISTVSLVIKVCLISPQHKRGKILTSILLTLLFFLFFASPMNVIQCLAQYVSFFNNFYVFEYAYVSASLNSTINPVIYFLVGREKKIRSRETLKIIIEKFFKDEDCTEGPEPTQSKSNYDGPIRS